MRYYAKERASYPHLSGVRLSAAEATAAITRLRRWAGIKAEPKIQFTRGNRSSRGGYHRILLNTDYLSWLLLVHEFGHFWDRQTHRGEKRKRWHDARHAELVQLAAGYVTARGWHLGALAHEMAERDDLTRSRQRTAAMPPPREARIAAKEAQIARLSRKIKALTTRRRNALRSLAMLKRYMNKEPV